MYVDFAEDVVVFVRVNTEACRLSDKESIHQTTRIGGWRNLGPDVSFAVSNLVVCSGKIVCTRVVIDGQLWTYEIFCRGAAHSRNAYGREDLHGCDIF